jgi:N-acyl-D-aspartate/D-glutamate deacylase
MANQLSASDLARKNGGDVRALTIPQPITLRINLFAGFLFDSLAGWEGLFRMSVEDRIRVLKDPAKRRQLDESARSSGPLRGLADWAALTVHAVALPQNKRFEGRAVGAIATEQGKAPIDAMLDLAISEGLRTSFMPPAVGGDKALWKVRGQLWADDRTVIGASDAGAHLDMIDTFAFSTQVLGNGVRQHEVITLPEAVHQLTQVPAELMGLRERGVLREGWHADLVVFDPATIGSGPVHMRPDLPCDEPRIYADAYGIEHVFVNGVEIVDHGRHTDALPGIALRSGRDTYTPAMRKLDPAAAAR